ncbi:MAG: hypothetical protein R3E87_25925 [Burkholderiaceae bacterium]
MRISLSGGGRLATLMSAALALSLLATALLSLGSCGGGTAAATGGPTASPADEANAGQAPPPGDDVATSRSASPAPQFPNDTVVTGKVDSPSMPRPEYLQPVAYPATGTQIVRITDEARFGGVSAYYRHAYSLRQPWNADETLLLLDGRFPGYLLDGRSLQLIGSFEQPSDPVWSNLDPNSLYGVAGNGLVVVDMSSRQTRPLHRFDEYTEIAIGGGTGNFSDDDRRIVLIGQRAGGVDVLVFDKLVMRVVSRRAFDGLSGPYGDIDEARISPSGRYVLLGMKTPSEEGYRLYDAGTMAFLRSLTAQFGHADMGWTDADEEALVTQDDASSAVVSIRLSDGVRRTELSAAHLGYNQHTSCRAIRRRGWCVISTFYEPSLPESWLYSEIFALKLDGSGTIERFSPSVFSIEPLANPYERQAHAVPSRDGARVLFASDWGDPAGDAIVHTYVAGRKVFY